MKKVLKFLFALSTSTFTPLSLVACKQEKLDENLNLIYKGKPSFNDIWNLSPNVKGKINKVQEEKKDYEKYLIFEKDKFEFQNNIAKNIVPKEFKDKNLVWFNEAQLNTKCYDFKFKNFKQEDNGDISWIFNQVNGTISVQISYFVGMITSEKTFDAHQKIDMTYEIKVGKSKSDEILDKWKEEFESKNWNNENPLQIEIKEKVKKGTRWADLDSSIKTKVYQVISDKFNNMKEKNISYSLNDVEKSNGIEDGNKLRLKINFNLNDAVGEIEGFYIEFI